MKSNSQNAVGDKDDYPERKVVVTEDATNFTEQIGIKIFETSAKDNINVESVFIGITKNVLAKPKEQTEKLKDPTIHVKKEKNTKISHVAKDK